MPVPLNHSPIRSLADIAALESAPLEQRLGPGDVAAWLEAGHARDPERVAISYLSDANPETTPQTLSHGALRSRAATASSGDDTISLMSEGLEGCADAAATTPTGAAAVLPPLGAELERKIALLNDDADFIREVSFLA